MSTVLKAGVMGWPVAHSRSPKLHNHWLSRYNITASYEALPVEPERLAAALAALAAQGFRGVNLTVPHKEAALSLMDKIDATAQLIGAVNTVVVEEDGKLRGLNTDAFGFIENIRHVVPDAVVSAWNGHAAVVLGAGGAARAVCVALMECGVSAIRIVNRTRTRADALIAEAPGLSDIAVSVDWGRRADALQGAGLLVNTTTLGMAGQPPLDLSLESLPREATVNDIVYAPIETDLLKQAALRGNIVVDGIGMLLHQARPAFQAWFGVDPVVDLALRRAVLQDD